MEWLKLLVSPVAEVINGFGERHLKKKELEQAKHMKTLEGIQAAEANEFLADMKRTEDLASTWKDEFITLVVSVPAIICFIPGADWVVRDGFLALGQAPEWRRHPIPRQDRTREDNRVQEPIVCRLLRRFLSVLCRGLLGRRSTTRPGLQEYRWS